MPVFAVEELIPRLREIFKERGLSIHDAKVMADIVLDAEASGRKTHGLIRVPWILDQLAVKGHPRGKWLLAKETFALYDGCNGLGYLVAYECTKKVIKLAGSSSPALVGARGATHTGPLGYFAGMCARKGLIGICLADCTALAAPFGAKSPVLGTNPLAFGIPFQPEPIIADLATTAVTYGDCRIAMAEGRRLPEGVALDSRGKPTTDPEAALKGGSLLPFGGHKGYALALVVQILTTALTGAAALPGMREDYGFTVIALRRDILAGRNKFDKTLKELIGAVKAAKPADPGKPVLIPGERSAARRREAFQKGIEIPQSLYEKIFRDRIKKK